MGTNGEVAGFIPTFLCGPVNRKTRMTNTDLELLLGILSVVLAAVVLPPAAGVVVLAYLVGLLSRGHLDA